ncbi:putative membrane protein [Malaciobacter halophilus]|uniref:hypothetical protein n=1 Tax=Malaciobacter halophilus TaxID=197482 RepID=UPI000E0BA84A|nr:hypothetical protein [Malaciobacter halophilus]AXH10050.1 putative membrane protein [Malaciobacter halophilus]
MKEEIYKPIWLIIIILMNIGFIGFYFYSNNIELNEIMILVMLLMNFLFWLYSFVSVLIKDFKKDSNKIVWFFALILIPPTFIIYLDLENKITIHE